MLISILCSLIIVAALHQAIIYVQDAYLPPKPTSIGVHTKKYNEIMDVLTSLKIDVVSDIDTTAQIEQPDAVESSE